MPERHDADDRAEVQEEAPERETGRARAEAPSEDDFDTRLDQALGRLVESGRLVGGEGASDGEHRASGGSESSSPSFDLDAAIERAFKRREEVGKADDERKSVNDRLSKLEAKPKGRWWDPWRP